MISSAPVVLGRYMEAEIGEQPAAFERILRNAGPHAEEVTEAIRSRSPRFVVLTARGTSDHAALYAKYLVETHLGLPAGLASPSTTTLYDANPNMRDVLFIAVSQSGESPDIVLSTERARRNGAVTVAITNNQTSPLQDSAEYHLDLLAGKELAVAATKSYTAELLSMLMLVDSLAGRPLTEFDRLPHQAAALVALTPEIASMAERYRFADHLLVTGRGYNYPTALEAALKLTETCGISAHAFSGADLLHGPMAMIGRGFPTIAIMPSGAGADAMTPVLNALVDKGADVLIVGDGQDARLCGAVIPLPGCPEFISPILAIIPMQIFALTMARKRGLDPDKPKGLSKVTRTV